MWICEFALGMFSKPAWAFDRLVAFLNVSCEHIPASDSGNSVTEQESFKNRRLLDSLPNPNPHSALVIQRVDENSRGWGLNRSSLSEQLAAINFLNCETNILEIPMAQ
jgi:hypothetical protein